MVDADPLRAEQALGNLLDNALTHASGTVRLTAAPVAAITGADAANSGADSAIAGADAAIAGADAAITGADASRMSGVRLLVTDDGPGLPHTLAGAVAFERFSRGDEARGRGGAGLGLAIVAAIARAHGGDAGADGATVWIDLPAAAPPPPQQPPAAVSDIAPPDSDDAPPPVREAP
ncbi:ATP-binding protein [Conexibacter sp. JD483]|uniref:ATP-binding protein n=1 Tax=Conexibacter sp. JD483 TaxID=3064471 RepID=UPI0037BED583